eukprot:TRINITY_DN35440_c0_g1_i1.p1 TRINITY_DN35440_c0_g1~~TRINITY_DN35440_c0_g1_i1.p1  ORF type:complete len:578 (-),score=129.39 TRINITY_DN35440_c0_g1_i1:493-2226(-)
MMQYDDVETHVISDSGADDMESVLFDHSLSDQNASSEYRSIIGTSIMGDSDPLSVSHSYYDDDTFRIVDDSDPLSQPPSYEEAVRDGVENGSARVGGGGEAAGGANGTSTTSPLMGERLEISVTDPVKEGDSTGSIVPGAGTYITYLVRAKTTMEHFTSKEMRSRRRFRDFVTLADRLAENYRGYLIPPRPDKNVMDSQVMLSKEFIDRRCKELQSYLRRLAAHPEISRSKELQLFLEADGKLPLHPSTDMASRMLVGATKLPRQLFGAESSSVLRPAEAAQPARGGSDLMRYFKEMRQNVTNEWVNTKAAVVEEDKEFLAKKEKLEDLEKCLVEASAKAESFMMSVQNASTALCELGLSLVKLGKTESGGKIAAEAQKRHGADCERLGTAAILIGRKCREPNLKTLGHLKCLHDYLSLMQAVHAAFQDRHQALLTVQTLSTDLATKKDKEEKLSLTMQRMLGGDAAKKRQLGALQAEVQSIQTASSVAEEEYEKIKTRNRQELERFDQERKRDLFRMVDGFVRLQVQMAEVTAAEWSKAADDLGRVGALRGGAEGASSSTTTAATGSPGSPGGGAS